MDIFKYYGLINPMASSLYFTQVIYLNKKTKKYFKLDSLGFNVAAIDTIVSQLYREETLDIIAKDENIEQVAYGIPQCRKKRPELKNQGIKISNYGDDNKS